MISLQLPDFLLALESKPPAVPRSPRLNPSSRTISISSPSGTQQKLRYAAYEPPPPARSRRPRGASSTRSTSSLDSYDELSRTVTAGDLAIAAGSPELRALSPVCTPHTYLRVMVRYDLTLQTTAARAKPACISKAQTRVNQSACACP